MPMIDLKDEIRSIARFRELESKMRYTAIAFTVGYVLAKVL